MLWATWQVCFDVPLAEEVHAFLAELPWAVWAVAGGLLYLAGFRSAGRVVAGFASTPGGRVAAALAWPLTLALFPVWRVASAVGRTVLAPLVRRLDAAVQPKGVAAPLAPQTRRTGGFVEIDGKPTWLDTTRLPPAAG
jgi:hypothetical protein